MTTRWFLIGLASLACAASVAADVIRIKGGETFRGKVVKRTPTEVVVQFEFGTMSFHPEEVEVLEVAEAPAAPAVEHPPAQPATSPRREPDATAVLAPSAPAPSPAAATPQPASQAVPETISLADATKAVAFIASAFEDGSVGIGSGTLISSKGVMVTNYHVVGEAAGVGVLLPSVDLQKGKPSRPYEARVLKVDPCYDLALVSIPVKTPSYLRFTDEEEAITTGAEVRAVGNPQGFAISVSRGIISAVRTLKELGLGLVDVDDFLGAECAHLSGRTLEATTFIQTDAAINPGNSGGPLLNAKNEIVGINTFIYSESGGSVGLNFALHVKHVKRFVGSYAKP